MDYHKIMENIMFQCPNTQEVEKYLVEIKESQSVTVLDGGEYVVFLTFANLYVVIREKLEITPELEYIGPNGKQYDASIVFGNLKYALQRISQVLLNYLNKPLQKFIY